MLYPILKTKVELRSYRPTRTPYALPRCEAGSRSTIRLRTRLILPET